MDTFKDHDREVKSYLKRSGFAFFCIIVILALLLARLGYLQIYHYEKYETLSKNNSVRLVATPPVRGMIYDRNGILLAENVPGYSLDIVPEQVPHLKKTLKDLQALLNITPEELKQFEKKRKQTRIFSYVPLRNNLSEEDMAKFSLQLAQFPGVEINVHLVRHYPYKELFAHTVGYVGRISEQELGELDPSVYAATLHIGKTGIEKYYETILHGKPGFKQIEIDAHGRMVKVLSETAPTSGKDITLTIDLPLQQRAFRALTQTLDPIAGAIVALDPNTGEVLAMVSNPTFDPNLFTNGIPQAMYHHLEHNSNRALFNRVIHGQYPPASTIKPFLALAGLESKVIDTKYSIDDHGTYQLHDNGRVYRDWRPKGHGRTNLHKAIRESCDTYFYGLAHKLGIDAISDWLSNFGFGKLTYVDLPGEKVGVVPSRAWKRKTLGTGWYQGETLSTGIGQGYMLVTPLQLVTGLATLANEGTPIYPHLLKQGHIIILRKNIVPAHTEHWKAVKTAMEAVIKEPQGTAHRLHAKNNFTMAGKTGTAQIFTIKQEERYNKDEVAAHLRDHTLFMGFAPVVRPKIAVATILEHHAGGADVARDIIEGYLLNHASKHTPS
jgi:penicillin-binding protein 2